MGRNYAWEQRVGFTRQPPGEGGALVGRQCLEASRPWGMYTALCPECLIACEAEWLVGCYPGCLVLMTLRVSREADLPSADA